MLTLSILISLVIILSFKGHLNYIMAAETHQDTLFTRDNHEVITHLISKEFSSSDVIIVIQCNENESYSKSYSTTTAKLNRDVSELLHSTQRDIFLTRISPNKLETHPDKKLDALKKVRRYNSQYTLILTFLTENAEEQSLNSFFNRFTTLFMAQLRPFTMKDEDFYVFVSPKQEPIDHSSSLVLFHPTVMEIKFKILISSASSETKTVCFYCNKGQPKIVNVVETIPTTTVAALSLPRKSELFPDLVRNGHGHTLRASSQTKIRFLLEIGRGNEDMGKWEFKRGYFWSVLKELLLKHNFTYTTFPAHGGGGSGTLKNGVWNGAVRDIMDGRADISMATTTDYSRYQVVGGTKPIAYEWVNFILGEPEKTYSWKGIFWSFDTTMWLLIGAANIFMLIVLKILILLEKRIRAQSKQYGRGYDDVLIRDTNFDKNMEYYLIAALLEQDVVHSSRRSSKIAFVSWLFLALILTTAYRSKLFGLLTFPSSPEQPQTFVELAESKYTWGMEASTLGSSAHNFFLTSPSPLYKRIYVSMEFEESTKQCFLRAFQSPFACLTFNGQAEYMMYRNYSSSRGLPLKLSPDSVAFAMPAIAMRKRAIYRTIFDRVIETAREMGVITKWKWMDYARERRAHLAWKQRNNINEDDFPDLNGHDSSVHPLTLKQLTGPSIILIAGSIVGVIGFLLELHPVLVYYIEPLYKRLLKQLQGSGRSIK